MDTLTHKPFEELSDDEIVDHMHVQDAERVFCVYEALKRGIDPETIYRITKIDWWFLDKMQHLADLEKGLAKCEGVLSVAQYKEAKKYGFQDKTIKRLAKVDKLPVENYRAGFKMVAYTPGILSGRKRNAVESRFVNAHSPIKCRALFVERANSPPGQNVIK